jgi:hypothetical protein
LQVHRSDLTRIKHQLKSLERKWENFKERWKSRKSTLGTTTLGHGGIGVFIKMCIRIWVSHLPSSHTNTHTWIKIHKDTSLPIYMCVCDTPPYGTKSYKYTHLNYCFHRICYYQSLEEVFLVGHFNAQT